MLHPRDEIAVNYMSNTNAQYRRSLSSRICSLEENIIELQFPKNESIAKFNKRDWCILKMARKTARHCIVYRIKWKSIQIS